MAIKEDLLLCPCESGKNYQNCCRKYIERETETPDAETLMRSRYTAFVQMNEAYLRYSWHPETCPDDLNLDKNTKWLGLKVKHGNNQHKDTVEFIARYKINGKAFRLHEISRFKKHSNRWVYLDGNS